MPRGHHRPGYHRRYQQQRRDRLRTQRDFLAERIQRALQTNASANTIDQLLLELDDIVQRLRVHHGNILSTQRVQRFRGARSSPPRQPPVSSEPSDDSSDGSSSSDRSSTTTDGDEEVSKNEGKSFQQLFEES